MKISIPEMKIGDVIKTNGFIGKVVSVTTFADCTQVELSFISGDQFNYWYLANNTKNGYAVIQGNESALHEIVSLEFEPE